MGEVQELGVGVSFHSGSIGWGSRVSISNYMYNHLGHLAEGHTRSPSRCSWVG